MHKDRHKHNTHIHTLHIFLFVELLLKSAFAIQSIGLSLQKDLRSWAFITRTDLSVFANQIYKKYKTY